MRAKAIVIVLALSTAAALWAVTPAKKKPSGTKKAVAKASTAKSKSKSKSKSSAKSAAGKKTAAKQASAKQTASRYRRSTQREPAPERYKEIQQSLTEKGYFSGSVNGAWGADSVDALKRFQRDQNIGDDGKLGSLSLIALGLGPKRGEEKSEAPAANPPPP